MKTLSQEYTKRVNSEISKTHNLLNAELKFSEDLRNLEMINFYENHLVKLNNML